MKKITLLLLPLMVACLAGCTGNNANKGGNSGEGSQDAKGTPVVTFWHTFGQIPAAALESKVTKFKELVKKNEGVDVQVDLVYQGGYSDMPKKVLTGLATGDGPSIAVAYPDHVADYFAEEETEGKYVVDLDKFINDPELTFGTDKYMGDKQGINDLVKSYMDEGRSFARTGTYLMPYMKSTEIMIYNLDACKRAMSYVHPEVPVDKVKEYMQTITWSDLLAIAQAAYEHKDEVSSTMDYPIYYDSDSNLFITELYQNNIGYSSIGEDKKGRIDFESGENLTKAKAVVQSLKDAHEAHLLTTKGVEGTYASNNFKEGKTIFSIGSTGGTGYTIPSGGTFEPAFAKVPTMGAEDRIAYISQGPSLCFLNNTSISKAQNDLNLLYSWKLVKYLTSTDVNVSLCVNGSEGYTPVRQSCFTTETYFDFLAEGEYYAEAAKVTLNDVNGRYFNSAVFSGSATLRQEVGSLVTNVLNGKSNLDDAFSLAINNTKKDIK